MGVYIKGMEMPTSCGDCRFCGGIADTDCGPCAWCDVDGKARVADTRQDCPLVPVPPHGRLIEDTAVREQIDEWLGSVGDVVVGHGLSYYGELLGCIEDAPTIIPAEEEEE